MKKLFKSAIAFIIALSALMCYTAPIMAENYFSYAFSVYGESESFTILDGNEENGYRVITNEYYGTHEYTDINKWLNGDFLISDNTLPMSIMPYVVEGSVSLLSSKELEAYNDRIKINANFGKTQKSEYNEHKYWWLSDYKDADYVYAMSGSYSVNPPKLYYFMPTAKRLVRPVFTISAEFFKNVRLNVFNMDKNLKMLLKDMDLTNAGYTNSELLIINNVNSDSVISFNANILPDKKYIAEAPYVEVDIVAEVKDKDGFTVEVSREGQTFIKKNVNFNNQNTKKLTLYLPKEDGTNTYLIELKYKGITYYSYVETIIYLSDVENDGYVLRGTNIHRSEFHADPESNTVLLDALGINIVRDHDVMADFKYDEITGFEFPANRREFLNNMNEAGIENYNILIAYHDGYVPETEEEIAKFTEYSLAIAKEYPEIKRFEFFNEVNDSVGESVTGDKLTTSEEYVRCVLPAAKALKEYAKSVDREIEIVIGGIMFTENVDWRVWLEEIAGEEIFGYVDALSYHAYNVNRQGDSDVFEKVNNDVVDILRRVGGWKELHITETGYTTINESKEHKSSFEGQANQLVKRNVFLDRLGLEININYALIDSAGEGFGLQEEDGTLKPSYYAMKNFYDYTQNAHFMGEVSISEDVVGYWYRDNGIDRLVVWQADIENEYQDKENGEDNKTLSFKKNVIAKDVLGNIKSEGTEVTVGYWPVWVENIDETDIKNMYSKAAASRILPLSEYLIETIGATDAKYFVNKYVEVSKSPNNASVTELIDKIYDYAKNIAESRKYTGKELSNCLYSLHQTADLVSKLIILCDDVYENDEYETVKAFYNSFEYAMSELGVEDVLYYNEPYKKGRDYLDFVTKFKNNKTTAVDSDGIVRIDKLGNVTITGDTTANSDVLINITNSENERAYIGYTRADESGKYSQNIGLTDSGKYTVMVNDGSVMTEEISYEKENGLSDDEKYTYVKSLQARRLLDLTQILLSNKLNSVSYLYLQNLQMNALEDNVEFSFDYDNTTGGNATIIVASYQNGKLYDCKTANAIVGKQNYEFDISVTGNSIIKIYLWDEIHNITPKKRDISLNL